MGYHRLYEQLPVNNFQFLFFFPVCSCNDIEKLERGMLRGRLQLRLELLKSSSEEGGSICEAFSGH